MDWFGWLSKTALEPSLLYEYGLTFAHNELKEDDIAYFNHDFLESMGISVAKYRLEILKFAKKERGGRPQPLSRLLAAIRKTRRYVASRLHDWLDRKDSSLTIVRKSNHDRSLEGEKGSEVDVWKVLATDCFSRMARSTNGR